MTDTVEHRLSQHGHNIPTAPEAVGFYVPVLRTGNLVVTSGQLPMVGKELMFKGKVGTEIQEAALVAYPLKSASILNIPF